MQNFPIEYLIKKISEKTKLSEAEIEEKINNKITELNSLVSKNGATYIIANELGVELFEKNPDAPIKLNQIYPGLKRSMILAKVININPIIEFTRKTDNSKGFVKSISIADETDKIRMVIWDRRLIDFFESNVKLGEVIKIINSEVKENKFENRELHLNSSSKIQIESNELLKEVIIEKSDNLSGGAERKKISEIKENEPTEFLGTIIRIYERTLFYESCPECKKALKEGKCPNNHLFSKPDKAVRLNMVVDDGTENISCLLFNKTVESLMNKTIKEMPEDEKELLNMLKSSFLGKQIIFRGIARKNSFSSAVEFIVNSVSNINLQNEIENLMEKLK